MNGEVAGAQQRLVFLVMVLCSCITSSTFAFQVEPENVGGTIKCTQQADGPQPTAKDASHGTIINPEDVRAYDRIAGVCLSQNGPLTDVSIEVFHVDQSSKPKQWELVATAKSGSSGKFEFKDLQTRYATSGFESNFLVVFRKPGYASRVSNSITWRKDELKITFQPAAGVTGNVKDEEGFPIPGASISFYSGVDARPDLFAAKTDMAGDFEIEDFHEFNSPTYLSADGKRNPTRRIPLRVSHPDYGSVGFMISRTPNHFEIMIRKAAKFRGRIVDEQGSPVADCRISMQSHSGEQYIWMEMRSELDGTFEFAKLPNVAVNVFFRTADLIGAAVSVTGSPGSTTDLGDLVIVKPVVAKGVVIDSATERPLASEDGRFRVGWHGPERPKTSAGISGTSIAADGTFECQFLPGTNYPYISSSELETLGAGYSVGLQVERGADLKLEFRVRRKTTEELKERLGR